MTARTATTLALVGFLLASGLVAVRTAILLNVAGDPLVPRYGLQDFRDNVYYPTVAYMDGRNPWDWEDYRAHYPVARPLPPYTPIFVGVHLPLAALSYTAAQVVFFAVNAALLIGVAVVALQGAGTRVTAARALTIAGLMALTRPGHQTLFLGQVAPLMTLATGLALVHAARRPNVASIGLLLACAKPTYGFPLALLLLARGDYGVVVRGGVLAAVVGGALAVVPFRAAGGLIPWVENVRGGLAHVAANDPSYRESTSIIRIDVGSLVGRVLGEPPSGAMSVLLAVAILGLAALAVHRLRAAEPQGPRPLSAGVISLALLISLYHQAYDALLLVFPVVALLLGRAGGGIPDTRGAWRIAAVACMLLPAVNYFSSNTLIRYVEPSPTLWLLITGANGIAVVTAYVLWLWLVFAPRPITAAK
jgi:hypothetical protein